VYDDLLIYRKRSLIKIREVTISYNQIAQVNLIRGIFFAEINIRTTGEESLRIRYISKSESNAAKKIIDQKIYHAHAKHRSDDTKQNQSYGEFEKSLTRLKELLNKGAITQKEYNKNKSALLKKF
jgi:hypothetical protein